MTAKAPAAPVSAPSPSTPADENAGKGGLYRKVDGKRVLVARTAPPKDEPAKPTKT